MRSPSAEKRGGGRTHALMRDHPGRTSQGGFSLLEVVVAFAILALSLGLLIQIYSRALTTTALSDTYSRAATLAEARLNDVGVDIPLEEGAYSGDPEDHLDWQVFIEQYVFPDADWELPMQPYLVTAVVSWDTAEGVREVKLSTLRLGEPL
jgi:general secretion pathway protein I